MAWSARILSQPGPLQLPLVAPCRKVWISLAISCTNILCECVCEGWSLWLMVPWSARILGQLGPLSCRQWLPVERSRAAWQWSRYLDKPWSVTLCSVTCSQLWPTSRSITVVVHAATFSIGGGPGTLMTVFYISDKVSFFSPLVHPATYKVWSWIDERAIFPAHGTILASFLFHPFSPYGSDTCSVQVAMVLICFGLTTPGIFLWVAVVFC